MPSSFCENTKYYRFPHSTDIADTLTDLCIGKAGKIDPGLPQNTDHPEETGLQFSLHTERASIFSLHCEYSRDRKNLRTDENTDKRIYVMRYIIKKDKEKTGRGETAGPGTGGIT